MLRSAITSLEVGSYKRSETWHDSDDGMVYGHRGGSPPAIVRGLMDVWADVAAESSAYAVRLYLKARIISWQPPIVSTECLNTPLNTSWLSI